MHEILKLAEQSAQTAALCKELGEKSNTVYLNELVGGAFSFYVYPSPSATHWAIGSALFLLSIFICILYE